MLAKDIMTTEVFTVKPDISIHDLAQVFVEKNISGVPVVDEQGKLLGIAREEGVIFQDKKAHLPTLINITVGFLTFGVKKFEDEVKKITATKVADILEKDIVTLSSDMSLEDVATIMIEKEAYYCPVVDDGKLVGIITKKDIVRTIAR